MALTFTSSSNLFHPFSSHSFNSTGGSGQFINSGFLTTKIESVSLSSLYILFSIFSCTGISSNHLFQFCEAISAIVGFFILLYCFKKLNKLLTLLFSLASNITYLHNLL